MSFTIGADPELFVKRAGKPVTAHGLIPGDKNAPYKVANGAVQVDGMALEFNIDPVPYNDFNGFNDNILSVMRTMKSMIPEGHTFAIQPSIQFDPEYYKNEVPESAKELGCDPDFCAYSIDPFEPNVRPDGDSGLRSAAGHIHVGWGSDIPVDNLQHVEICRAFVKNMDVFVGLGMTLIDDDTRRRELYGKAGAFRPKSYGVEYRTPSNAWLTSKAKRMFIHSLVVAAINDMKRDRPKSKVFAEAYGEDYIAGVINRGDKRLAYSALQSAGFYNIPEEFNPRA